MTLEQQVIEKIDALGIETAAQLSGLSVNQIKTMRRTGNVTLKAYKKLVLQAQDQQVETPQPTEVVNATYTSNGTPLAQQLASLEQRIQTLEEQFVARVIVSDHSLTRPVQEVPQPARPLNAPPIVSGHGAFDGIAPSAADANSEGAGGSPAGPALHNKIPVHLGTQGWNAPMKPKRQ